MRLLKISFFVVTCAILFPFCQKEHSLEQGIKKFSVGDWEFKAGGVQFVGPIDSAYIVKLAGNKKSMVLMGTSLNGVQQFYLHLSAVDSFTNGSYKASLLQADFKYKAPAKTIYQADQLIGEFEVTITDLSNNHITGIFSGEAQDSLSSIADITEGKFSADIDLGNNTGSGGFNATGNLGSTAGSCTPIGISGSYTKGIAMDASNNILIQVNVTNAGNYNISTSLLNGVKFLSIGTFTTAGMQNVQLQAIGIPTNAGNQVYTVGFGLSSCNFTLNFATNTASLDYFPMTVNSNWTYYLVGGTSSDSIYTKVLAYTATFFGIEYKSFNTNTIPPQVISDTEYYRKSGNDYYQFVDFASVLPFDGPVLGEYIFLKDNVPSGTSWQSPDFSGTIAGVPVTFNIKMIILAKNFPANIGPKNFADVIKIRYEYFLSTDPTTPIATEERWFARGAGLIHDDIITSSTYDIADYTIF